MPIFPFNPPCSRISVPRGTLTSLQSDRAAKRSAIFKKAERPIFHKCAAFSASIPHPVSPRSLKRPLRKNLCAARHDGALHFRFVYPTQKRSFRSLFLPARPVRFFHNFAKKEAFAFSRARRARSPAAFAALKTTSVRFRAVFRLAFSPFIPGHIRFPRGKTVCTGCGQEGTKWQFLRWNPARR